MAVRDQLVPSIVLLPNLTSLTLENIVVNVELVRAIGQLPNLAFLTYDVVYPNSHLALNPLFGTFSTDQFNNDPCLPPSSLQSLSVRFMCEDGEYLAFDILKSILYASRNTLQVINIDFNQCCGWMPLHKIISEYYPSLRRFCVYHACFAWASFAPFYSAHSKTLQHVSVFFHSDPDVEEPTIDQSPRRESLVLLRDIPGLSSFTTPEHKTAPWRIESFTIKLGIDPSDNITAREMTLMRGRWEMLPYIAMEHPYIQVLNMWDGALFSGNTIVEVCPILRSRMQLTLFMQTLRVASPGLTKVEVLRFNCGRRGLDGLCKVDLRPLGILCDSDQPNTWCRCASCEAGIYTEEGRNCLREEWEDVVWQSYQDQIRRILPFMPRLKLVEWFVGWRVSTLHEVPIPFWEWNIDRLENGRPHLKRRLRNWPCNNPFVEKVPWSAARGMGSTV